MAVRLFVGNLPFSVTEAELREHFSAAGPVAGVWLAMDRETGRPRGFAFVEYDDRAHAEDAIRRFNNQPLGGRNLAVNEARPQERSGGSGGYRPGTSSYSARPPRPEGGGSGGGGGFDRPRPPAGPRPGFGAEAPPAEDFGRGTRDRSRNFGPDAPAARKKRKNDRKGGERGPKRPLQVTSQGRFYGGDGDEDFDDLSDLDAMFADDDAELEGDEDADSEGDEDAVEDGDGSTAEDRKTDE